jgi:hypothetical protein
MRNLMFFADTPCRGRIDLFGTEAIPLYEHEAERAVEELLAKDIEGLVVNLLFSYVNPAHGLCLRSQAINFTVFWREGTALTARLRGASRNR